MITGGGGGDGILLGCVNLKRRSIKNNDPNISGMSGTVVKAGQTGSLDASRHLHHLHQPPTFCGLEVRVVRQDSSPAY